MAFEHDMFMQSAARPGVFSAATPPRYSPFGMPELDANPMLGMAMTFGMQWLFGSDGYLPGQLMPQQNMLDQIRAREYQASRLAALQRGFDLDRPSAVRMMEGAARTMGLPFGASQAQAANAMAGDLMAAMPFLAPMAPGTFDAMFGSKGSRGILTSQIFDRGLHEVDPVTGLVGLSPETAAARAGSIYRDVYDQAPGRGLVQTRGMGAGAIGSMYAEMRRLGLDGGSIADLSPGRQAAALGVGAGELSSPAADKLKRDYDSRQAVQGITRLAGAVSAVRDLFGEHGRPDAPMQELFQKLNDLTAGGLAMQDPQRLEQMVRQTQATLKIGGVTLDAYSSLLGRGGHLAQTMGVDPSSAAGFTLDAVGFASSAGSVRGMFAPAAGRLDKERLAMTDQQLRAAARGSGQAAQLGALVRFQEEVGGLQGEDLAIYEAIKAGGTTYGPDGKPLYFNPGEIQGRLARYMGAADAGDYIRQQAASQEYIDRYRIDRVVREAGQPAEARQAATIGFFQSLRRHGFANDRKTRDVAASMGSALFGLDLDASADAGRRNAALADALRGMVGDRADLDEIVSSGYGAFGEEAQRRLNRSPQAALQLFSEQAMGRARRDRRQAADEAALAEALSPLNRSGPLARFADLLKNPADGFVDGLGRLLGVTGAVVGDSARRAVHGLPDAAGSIAQADPGGRLALASGGVQAAYRMFEDARRRGAPRAELDAILGGVRGLVGGGEEAEASLRYFRDRLNLGDDAAFSAALGNETFTRSQVRGGARDRQAVLRGLVAAGGRGGVMGLMEDAGVATSSQVSAEDVANLGAQAAAADRLRAGGAAGSDLARLGRIAGASVKETLRITDLAMGDENTLKGLRSSFQDMEALRGRAVELEALAAEHGLGVDALIAYSGADPRLRQAAEKARALHGSLAAGALGLERRAGGKGRFDLGQADKDAVAARRGLDPAKRNARTLDEVLRATGGTLDPKQREALLARMSESRDPELLGARIRQALSAYKDLEEKDAAGGLSDEERRSLESATHGLSAVGPVVVDPSTRAYKGHAGVDSGTTRKGVESLLEGVREKEKADDEKSRTMKFTFAPGTSVRIVDRDRLDFTGAEAVGSTPPLS